jgi:hypothetical protein
MNRRHFLAAIGTVVGGLALDQAIPFNRVWSFASQIRLARRATFDDLFGPPLTFKPGDVIVFEGDVYSIVSRIPSDPLSGIVGRKYGFDYISDDDD